MVFAFLFAKVHSVWGLICEEAGLRRPGSLAYTAPCRYTSALTHGIQDSPSGVPLEQQQLIVLKIMIGFAIWANVRWGTRKRSLCCYFQMLLIYSGQNGVGGDEKERKCSLVAGFLCHCQTRAEFEDRSLRCWVLRSFWMSASSHITSYLNWHNKNASMWSRYI